MDLVSNFGLLLRKIELNPDKVKHKEIVLKNELFFSVDVKLDYVSVLCIRSFVGGATRLHGYDAVCFKLINNLAGGRLKILTHQCFTGTVIDLTGMRCNLWFVYK